MCIIRGCDAGLEGPRAGLRHRGLRVTSGTKSLSITFRSNMLYCGCSILQHERLQTHSGASDQPRQGVGPKTRARRTGLRVVLYEGVLQHGTTQATVQSVRNGDSRP